MGASWLFVMWAGGGNVSPFLRLGRELVGRGHRVGAVVGASLDARVADAGIEVVLAADGWLPGADHVQEGVRLFRPDALVVDYMLTAGLCAAERHGLPRVALVHTLYADLLVEGAPLPMSMAGSVESVNKVRADLGLATVTGLGEMLSGADLVMVTAPRELDGPGPLAPDVEYVGALYEEAGPDANWQPPAGQDPLVTVCLGTSGADPAREEAVLGRVLAALGGLRVRGFVTLPGYLDRADLTPPANVAISGYVRHAAVLPHASVLVTHAGLGSVVAALAHGVPMVCLPLDREQPHNAAAVARIDAGTVLAPDARADDIADAISRQITAGRRRPISPDPGRAVAVLEGVLNREALSR